MRQKTEHSLTQVTTHGAAQQQRASVLADLCGKILTQAQREITASSTWALLGEKWQQRTNATIIFHYGPCCSYGSAAPFFWECGTLQVLYSSALSLRFPQRY